MFGARNNYATALKHGDKGHGHEVDMLLNKYELTTHPKTYWNTINQAWQVAIKLSRFSQNLGRQNIITMLPSEAQNNMHINSTKHIKKMYM